MDRRGVARYGMAGEVRQGKAELGGVWFGRQGMDFNSKEDPKMIYQFKPGSRLSADPQAAGEMCETLAANGGLTARRLLDANRDASAPLHNVFEWDDAVAAENYREQQAGHVIRSIVVVREKTKDPPVRAFINVQEIEREYKPLGIVVKSPDLSAQMLESARRDLEVFRQKYVSLSKLAPIFTAMECVFEDGGESQHD